MRPFTKHPLSLLISASVLALSLPALAQDDAEDNALLEEITVTATKRAASVADIPFNISAIGEKELRKRNITDLKALLQDSVEISAPANSARVADSVTVRGLNVSPVNQNNLEFFVRSTLAYYLDETPLPNIGYRIKDIARVETLLGPQGTLYGSGSLGGTIRYITNQPEFDEFTADFNTGLYQSAGGGLSSDTDIVVNLPLGETLALRGSLAYLDEAGYTDRVISPAFRDGQNGNPPAWTNPNGSDRSVYEDDDYQRATTGKLALAWKINDDAKLTLTHASQDQLAHGSRGGTLDPDAAEDTFQYDMDTNVARYEEFSDRSFDLTSVDLEWALGFADLASSTSYFKDSREGQANYGIGFVYYGDWGWSGLTPENTSESPYMLFDNTYSGLSHETRLVSNNEGPLNWVGGIYYTEQKRNLTFSERFPSLDQVGGIDRDAVGGDVDEGYSEDINSNYKEVAVFGELTYAITDQWDVTGGVRVFNYSDEADPQITDYAFGLVDTKGAIENKESGKRFYKLNTSYDLTDNMMLYATASQGFRRGGTNGFKDLGGNTVADTTQNYEPDSVDNYEMGIKGNLFDDALYVQTNVYRINWKNTQTYFSQDVNFFPLNGTVNGPDAVSKGWEFSSRLNVTDQVSLTYGTATTQAEWAETKEVCTYADGSECRSWEKGGKLGGAPKWRHKLGVNFDTTLGNGLGLNASVRGSYTSKIQSDRADSPDDEVYEYDAYTLWHANAGISSDNWDAGLWIQNLTNKRAEVSYQAENYVGDRVITTQPRTVGVNFSYHW